MPVKAVRNADVGRQLRGNGGRRLVRARGRGRPARRAPVPTSRRQAAAAPAMPAIKPRAVAHDARIIIRHAWRSSPGVSSVGALIAGLPLAAPSCGRWLSAASRVTLGVSTSSFRDLPRVTGRDNLDDVIRALRAVGGDARGAGARESRARAAEHRAGDGRVGRVSAPSRADAGGSRGDQQRRARRAAHVAAADAGRRSSRRRARKLGVRRDDRARVRASLQRFVFRRRDRRDVPPGQGPGRHDGQLAADDGQAPRGWRRSPSGTRSRSPFTTRWTATRRAPSTRRRSSRRSRCRPRSR